MLAPGPVTGDCFLRRPNIVAVDEEGEEEEVVVVVDDDRGRDDDDGDESLRTAACLPLANPLLLQRPQR